MDRRAASRPLKLQLRQPSMQQSSCLLAHIQLSETHFEHARTGQDLTVDWQRVQSGDTAGNAPLNPLPARLSLLSERKQHPPQRTMSPECSRKVICRLAKGTIRQNEISIKDINLAAQGSSPGLQSAGFGNEPLAPHSPGRLPARALLFRPRTARRCISAQPGGSVLPTQKFLCTACPSQVPMCSTDTTQSIPPLVNGCMRTGPCGKELSNNEQAER